MKHILVTFALLAWVPLVEATFILNVPVNESIPDGDLAGIASTAIVSGESGTISDLSVTLNITGTYNGDLYAYLAHDSGFAVLLNRPGRTASDPLGYANQGLNVIFSDTVALDIHNYGGNGLSMVTGTYRPDGRNVSPLDVLDTTPRTTMLASFNGLDPNGEWRLFVADASGGDLQQLVSWGIQFETYSQNLQVPEAGCGIVGGLLLATLLAYHRRATGSN